MKASSVQEFVDPKDLIDDEKAQVREQMERLLETHHFRHSRRYPALLRFIVEETLEGRGEHLKERLLGISVFERAADYDTASDPIVRVTVAEIRKRIAQYYHDEEHDEEIRIELLPGRYMPEFRKRRELGSQRVPVGLREESLAIVDPGSFLETHAPAPAGAHTVEAALRPPFPVPQQAVVPVRRAAFGRKAWAASAAILVAVATTAAWLFLSRPTAVERMWNPLLAPQKSVLFCLPTDVGKKVSDKGAAVSSTAPEASTPGKAPVKTFLDYEAMGENVVYSDMIATLDIVNVLATRHRDYHVRLNTTTTLDDMRVGPTVLIGGLDNQWTMRALAPLRFHFAGSDEESYWIADEQNLANRAWSLDLRQQYQKITRDYAIVARLHNEQTGQLEVIVAGIGMSGTAAAGAYVADERAMLDLQVRLGPAFKDKDFEVVLSTDVVNGISGSAKVLGVTSW